MRLKYIAGTIAAILCWDGFSTYATAESVHTWANHSALAQGEWVKVALNRTQDGIYQISYSQLRSWGFSDPSQVGVYGFGGHVLSTKFDTDHTDDLPEVAVLHDKAGQRILFYGQGILSWYYKDATTGYVQKQHPYASAATYFLHQKSGEAPLSLLPQASGEGTPVVTLNDYDERWLHETESVNLGETGQNWYGESFLTTQGQLFSLPEEEASKGHILKAGTARLTINYITKAGATTSFSVVMDKEKIATTEIPATTGTYNVGTEKTLNVRLTDKGDLSNAKLTITFAPAGASPTAARLDYIRLQGKSLLEADGYQPYLLFRNAEAINKLVAYRIQGVTDKVQVWDITSPQEIRQQTLVGDSIFVATEKGLREYAIVDLSRSNFPTVTRIGSVRNQDLHGMDSIQLVILTPSALMQQAEELAQHRLEQDHLSSLVLTPDAIYNEYSSGVPDATAIRLFLKHLYDKNVNENGEHYLRYFLLFGDGTYDNRSACRSKYLLPTYQTEASLVQTSSSVCDDYFGFLDDSEGCRTNQEGQYMPQYDRLDIGIGRLPVSTAEQAQEVVDKITGYNKNQYGNWKNRLVFLSDDDKMEGSGSDSPNLHMNHNEQLITQLQDAGHKEYMYQKIYLPAYQQTTSASGTDYPDARKAFNNVLKEGTLLMNYAGHGSTTSITHEQILTSNSAQELRMKHLPVWVTASCEVSRFDQDEKSMGENLMLNPNGGAVAMFTTTRVVYATNNLALNKAIFRNLFKRNADGSRYRLGDLMRTAKVEIGSDYNKLNFCLLGDPSMTMAFPDQKIVVDSITGIFAPLQTVTVHGRVLAAETQETDTLYNGLIYPTVFDTEDSLTADKGLYQDPILTFASRQKKIFTGRDIISKGRFEFDFMVPKDLSDNDGKGLINLYACSEWGIEANGYYEDFEILKDNTSDKVDTIGPIIVSCFLDDPDGFKSGSLVGATPFFYAEVYDPSGINASGNSIGHDICLNVKCISNPLIANRQYILNNYFTNFTGTSKYGNVKYSITDLPEGTYEATFRVWDTFNNVSSYTFQFTISLDTSPEIALLQAFPSPVKQGETVTFRAFHNRPESSDILRLQVYTQAGVKVLEKTISSNACETVYLQPGATSVTEVSKALNADETSQLMGSTTLQWTANVAPGVYMYRAYLTAGSDETATKSQKLIVY